MAVGKASPVKDAHHGRPELPKGETVVARLLALYLEPATESGNGTADDEANIGFAGSALLTDADSQNNARIVVHD